MFEEAPPHIIASSAGLGLGILLGWVIQRSNFCAMGAISDYVIFRDSRRLRSWFLAIAVAMALTQVMAGNGLISLEQSIYLQPRLQWGGAILGGLLFGIGMVFAGGCGNRNLARLGSGDLRALAVIITLGITAEMALRGLFAIPRLTFVQATMLNLEGKNSSSQSLTALAGLEGLGAWGSGLVLAFAIAALCLMQGSFRQARAPLLAGIVVGLLVAAGWWVTGVLAADDFEPVPLASLTFVAPVGDGLLYLMTFTGSQASFGIAVVAGVVLGAAAGSLLAGQFRIQGFADYKDVARSLLGAALMGIGGVTATGCTIGQGITGVSTLSASSFLALGAIVLGGVIGIHLLERFSD